MDDLSVGEVHHDPAGGVADELLVYVRMRGAPVYRVALAPHGIGVTLTVHGVVDGVVSPHASGVHRAPTQELHLLQRLRADARAAHGAGVGMAADCLLAKWCRLHLGLRWVARDDDDDAAPRVVDTYTGEPSCDAVNHPSHYNTGSIEVIDAIEDWRLGFSLGNAVKYIARAAHKGKMIEDLKKARWYLDREIQRLEREAGDDLA